MTGNLKNHRANILTVPVFQNNDAYDNYLKQMKELKIADSLNDFDNEEKEKGLSNNEKIYAHIMEMERQSIIANKYTYRDYPPANMFYDVRDKIEKTYTFELLKRLPKGGNLHIHTSSTWDAEEMLVYFKNDNELKEHVYVYTGENNSEMKLTKGQLLYIEDKNVIADSGLTEKMKLLSELNDEEFESELDLITFGDSKRMDDVDYIWDEFNNVFSRVRYIINVRKIYRLYYTQAFLTLCRDNVDYVELRFGVCDLCDNNDNLLKPKTTSPTANEIEYTERYKECLDEIKQACQDCRDFRDENNDQPYKDFKLKLIISTSRKSADFDSIIKLMKATQEWEKTYKDYDGSNFIIGFDFVSEEDLNYKTDFYAKAIYDNNMEDIGFYFHDGESNWADDDNVMAAVCLNTKRIGHGFNIYRFPAVVDKVIKDKICLEVCPISNQLLRYSPDLRSHPIGEYIKRGVPVVICSDDPQIFDDKGLTYDFWEFYFSQMTDMYSIKQAIRNSYIYSAMSGAGGEKSEKQVAIDNWENKWHKAIDKYIPDSVLACAAMFDRYYDKIKNTSENNGKLVYFSLNNDDMKLWKENYQKLLKEEGITDGGFFKDGDKNPNIGVGDDGVFNKFEYCNIMYQLFKYLYINPETMLLTGVRTQDIDNVSAYVSLLEKYVDKIEGRSPTDNKVISLDGEDMTLWTEKYYPYISKTNIVADGSFWGDNLAEPNYGIGKDGKFSGRELLHFLFQCYKFMLFNKPWERTAENLN